MTTLYLVVPCYNEQEVLPETSKRLLDKLSSLAKAQRVSDKSRIVFVDDGSRDGTWGIISGLLKSDARFAGVKLSRNRGHQNALLAGLTVASQHCDAAISLDADLQDDIDAIDEMLARFEEGFDIVYGVRSARDTDTVFKRGTAQGFYRLMKAMGVDIVNDHADYRLMSKRALEGLLSFGEVNLFLRGIVPQIGYPSAIVTYRRGERFAGESKYPLKKMLAFAIDGITSFSTKPIRLIFAAGVAITALSGLWFIIMVILCLVGRSQGYVPIAASSLWVLGGLELIAMGVVGEYIGKIYGETKRRPRFIIEELDLR